MRRTLVTAVLVTIVGVLVGMGIGGFVTYKGVSSLIKSIPGSPVVVGAQYDKDQNALVLNVFNPGGLPMVVETTSLIFKPKNGQGYALANIPANVTVPGGAIVQLVIKLKAESKGKVQIGDILQGGFTYRYPGIPQTYFTSYPLVVGKPVAQNPTEVLNKAKEEAQKVENQNK
jgi:hypothetical protein